MQPPHAHACAGCTTHMYTGLQSHRQWISSPDVHGVSRSEPGDPTCTVASQGRSPELTKAGSSMGRKHTYLSIQRGAFAIKPGDPALYSAEIFLLSAQIIHTWHRIDALEYSRIPQQCRLWLPRHVETGVGSGTPVFQTCMIFLTSVSMEAPSAL